MDVYSQLYELAGLTEPPTAERTKPPCCGKEDGKPPVEPSCGIKYTDVSASPAD
jgi:hypothetical protein